MDPPSRCASRATCRLSPCGYAGQTCPCATAVEPFALSAASAVRRRLQVEQFRVSSAECKQLGMAARLDETSCIDDQDEIGHSHRRESMRDEDCYRTTLAANLARDSCVAEKQGVLSLGSS